ncbi:hypothetical protein KEM54_000791 [Ascosphaera aggregata]|nr:hypothetical protein KEM54_000791 [Ascosphaera aggregata]
MGLFHRRERSSSSAAAQGTPPSPIQTRYRSGSHLGPRPEYQEYAPPPGPPPSHTHQHSVSAGYQPQQTHGYGRVTEPDLHEKFHHMTLGTDSAYSAPTTPRAARRGGSPNARSPSVGRRHAHSRTDEASDQLIASKYGLLFDNLGRPTTRWDELVRGIADYIVLHYPPENSLLTPEKLAHFYARKTAAADAAWSWSVMFSPNPDNYRRLERLYQELAVECYEVPTEPHSRVNAPAMTHRGFQRWLTLMVEAFPDQEHERLNKVMATMEIYHPSDKSERYPSRLPRILLPQRPNPDAHKLVRYAMFEHFNLTIPGPPVVQVHGPGGGGVPPDGPDPIRAVARRHMSPAEGRSRSRSASRGRLPPRINVPADDEVFTEGGPGVGNLSASYTGAMGTLSSPVRSRPSSMTSSGQRRLTTNFSPEADRTGRTRRTTVGARYESPLRSPNTPASVPDDSWHDRSPPPSFSIPARNERSPAASRPKRALEYRDSGESLFGRRY